MKFYLITILCIILTSCSKKTHISDAIQTSTKLQEDNDSIGMRDLLSIDKSVTTTNIDLDTTISITGKPLFGTFNLKDSIGSFENDDLIIGFTKDKAGLSVGFKASPKVKTVKAHYHQKSLTQNNIFKTDNSQLNTLKKITIQHDSASNHVADDRGSTNIMGNLKATIVWVIILLIAVVVGFFILKRKLLRF